jgi:hypothetical protein
MKARQTVLVEARVEGGGRDSTWQAPACVSLVCMMKFRMLLLSLTTVCALRAQEVTVPDRPEDFILDQTGTVTTEQRREAVEALKPAAEKDGLGIYLVLLNSAAEEPPADVARRLAQSWRVTPDTAVVLTAPDMKPPLLVEVTGVALGAVKEEELQMMKNEALADAAKAPPGVPAMMAAARSLAARMKKFRGGEPLAAVLAAKGPEETATHLSAWIAGGALVCCLAALLLMRRSRHHALIFPQTEPRRRFSAPHSGGNDALVFFGKGPH